MIEALSSIAILASFVLITFGARGILGSKGRHPRSWLMIAAGVVIVFNVIMLYKPVDG